MASDPDRVRGRRRDLRMYRRAAATTRQTRQLLRLRPSADHRAATAKLHGDRHLRSIPLGTMRDRLVPTRAGRQAPIAADAGAQWATARRCSIARNISVVRSNSSPVPQSTITP